MSVVKTGDKQQSSMFTGTYAPGDGKYMVRFRDTQPTEYIDLYQSVTVPVSGKYTISAKLIRQDGSKINVDLYAGSLSVANNSAGSWQTRSFTTIFTKDEIVRIGLKFTNKKSSNDNNGYKAGADDVTISYIENVNGPALAALIAQARSINTAKGGLTDVITAAQNVYDNIDNTPEYQDDIDGAISTLKSAIATKVAAIGFSHRDDVSYLIANAGFEGITAETGDYTTVSGKDYAEGGWILDTTCDSGRGAVLTYDSGYKVNAATIPANDNAGNGGKALGLNVGWKGTHLYKTAPITLPAGKYILKVNGYNAGTNTPLASKFGFVPTSGDATLSTKTSYTLNTWEEEEVVITLASATEGCFQLGGTSTVDAAATSTAQVFFDNITLTYVTEEGYAKERWDAAKAAAEAAYGDDTYSNVTGSEKTALETEIGKSEPSTVADYDTATEDLTTATSTFTAAKPAYDSFDTERDRAIALGVDSEDIVRPTSADNLQDALNALIVLEDAAVTANYTEDATEFVGTWSKSNTGDASDKHWSGTTKGYYYKYFDSGNSTMSVYKTVTLPAGSYVLKAAATCKKRNGDETNFYLGVQIGGDWTKEYYTGEKGYNGLGIAKNGLANYTAASDTYANSDNGYGWEWRFVGFTLENETEVQLKIAANILNTGWVAFSDIALFTTDDNINYYKTLYNNAKSAAEAALEDDTYENVDGAEKKALTDAIAETDPDPDVEWYQDQKTALEEATATFTDDDVVANYNRLAAAIAEADAIETSHTSYDVTSTTTAAEALTNANALYTAMLNAQKTAKAKKTLGFESGEYAPYNNVDILAAWANADAITSVADATTDALNNAISALNDASWSSANAIEVNAIYDGTLKDAPIQATSANVVLPGWVTKSGNIRQTFKGSESKACLAGADDGVGVFVHPGTYNYGETTGYTMPLKANVLYTVKVKYCSWENNSNNNFTLTIKKGSTNVVTKSFGANKTACTVEGALKEVELSFMADESADYVLSVVTDGNTFMTDFYFLKATALTINDTDADVLKGFTNEVDITVNRTLVANKWQGFSLPFSLTAGEIAASALNGASIAEFDSDKDNTGTVIYFKEATAIEAGVPYLIKPAEGENITSMTFTGKTIAAGVTAQTIDEGAYQFVAQLYNTPLSTDGTIAYMSTSTQKVTKLTSGGIKGTRAYFIIPSGVAPARIVFEGDEVTSIDGTEFIVQDSAKDVYYDLQGRKVTGKPTQRGIYIVNGKKMFVK